MTPEARVITAATHLVRTGPTRRDPTAYKATVRHDALAELRQALEALGIDTTPYRARAS